MQSHKEPTTFEEFASRVFSPAPESASSSKPSTPAAERHGFTRNLVVSNDLSKSSIRNRSKSAVTKPTMEAEKLRLGKAYWVALTSVILSFLLVCLFVCLFFAPFSAPPVLCRFFLSCSLFPLSSIGFFSCFVYFACLFAVLSFVFFPALNSHPFCLFRLSYLGFVLSFSRTCLLSCFSPFVFFACLISGLFFPSPVLVFFPAASPLLSFSLVLSRFFHSLSFCSLVSQDDLAVVACSLPDGLDRVSTNATDGGPTRQDKKRLSLRWRNKHAASTLVEDSD